MTIDKALIIAAGKGERLREMKSEKALVKVNGKPLICNIIDNLEKCGINRFYIVAHKNIAYRELDSYYHNKKIDIKYIWDDERKGSLWSFAKGEGVILPPFVCTDCDLICEAGQLKRMLQLGKNKIETGKYDGMIARVLNPTKDDVNMLQVNRDVVVQFSKQGGEKMERGGYIYIWNFDGIFEEAKMHIENQTYSLAKYINHIVDKYKIGIMDIEDLWDVDTKEDILFTNEHFREASE